MKSKSYKVWNNWGICHRISGFLIVGVVLLLSAFAGTAARAEVKKPIPIGVFEFDSAFKVMRHNVSDLVIANLSANPRFILVDRSDLKKVLNEQALGLSGNITADTAARAGQLTGAKVLITGRVFKTDGNWTISTRIIGAETGRIFSSITQGSKADLMNMTSNIVQQISEITASHSDDLFATSAVNHEERLAKIMETIKGKKRPTIKLKMSEATSSEMSPGDATENELKLIFKKAGFKIVDAKKRADILVSGHVSAPTRFRVGKLFASKAHLEIQAKRIASGKILFADSQVNFAVDLNKELAAMQALENATDALAERFLPLLAR